MRRWSAVVFVMVAACAFAQQQQQPVTARGLLAKIAQALGGAERLQAISGLRFRWNGSFDKGDDSSMTMYADTLFRFPDQTHTEAQSGALKFTFVITPDDSFIVSGKDIFPLTDERTIQYAKIWSYNVVALLHRANDPDFTSAIVGEEQIGDFRASILELRFSGKVVRLAVDPDSGRIFRESFVNQKLGTTSESMGEFSDWHTAKGITFPFRLRTFQNGREIGSVQVSELQVDPPSDAALFVRPPTAMAAGSFHPDVATPVLTIGGQSVAHAELTVASQPGGAEVFLNDELRGATSQAQGKLTLPAIDAGDYVLRVSANGYRDWTRKLRLAAGENTTIEAQLIARKDAPLSCDEIVEMLKGGVSNPRMRTLVQKQGVDFQLDDASEKRIRAAGGDSDLLVVVAKSKK